MLWPNLEEIAEMYEMSHEDGGRLRAQLRQAQQCTIYVVIVLISGLALLYNLIPIIE